MNDPDVKGSVLSGAAWMLGARLVERALGLVSTAVLARILAPEDFGLVAMAMVFVAAADLLGAFGLDWALVRQKNLTSQHLDTVWTIRASLGLGALILLILLSFPAARFYREPRIEAMLWVLGMSLFIGSLENPGIVIFRREMQFSKEFALRLITKLSGMIVAVTAAILLRSYWALLLGTICGRAAGTAASYVMHNHRPGFTLSRRAELMNFSAWLFVGNLLTFLRTRVVELALGRIAGPKQLGIFAVSNEISQLASTEFAAPINRALFSDYARKSDRPVEIASAYLRAAPLIWMIAIPAALGTGLVADQVVMLLLGNKWGDAVPVLKMLAFAGALGLLSTNALHVYWAIGRAALEAIVEGIAAVTLLVSIWFLVPAVGIIGAAWAVLGTNAVLAALNAVLLNRFAGVQYSQTFRRTWRTVAACAVMVLTVDSVTSSWTPTSSGNALAQAGVIAGFGAAVYAVSLAILWKVSGTPVGPEADLMAVLRGRLAGRLQRQ